MVPIRWPDPESAPFALRCPGLMDQDVFREDGTAELHTADGSTWERYIYRGECL